MKCQSSRLSSRPENEEYISGFWTDAGGQAGPSPDGRRVRALDVGLNDAPAALRWRRGRLDVARFAHRVNVDIIPLTLAGAGVAKSRRHQYQRWNICRHGTASGGISDGREQITGVM